MTSLRALLSLAAFGTLTLFSAAPASATSSPATDSATRGRPAIVLDRLVFPDDVAGASHFVRHLRHTLRREARRADWGAGRGHRIEYRFFVEELRLEPRDGVLRVTCTALGKLPKGRSARSHLSFSGEPAQKNALIERVLDIVARGVLTRLAELERSRRGAC